MRARGTRIALVVAIALLAFAPSPAPAATTIGSDLSHAPNLLSCGGASPAINACSFANASLLAPAAGGLAAPFDGVIVRWRVRASGSPTTTFLMGTLHVLSANTLKHSTSGVSLPFVDTVTSRETRLPVATGDRIGLTLAGIAINGFVIGIAQYASASPSPGSTDRYPLPLTDGAAQAPGSMLNVETLVNADVEADVDHDGFGDETQDACPGSALSQSSCVPAAITRPRFIRGQGFSINLSEAASLNALVDRLAPGRAAKGGKCLARTKRGTRCTIVKRVKAITAVAAPSGSALIPFAPKTLAGGSYRATFSAITPLGQQSSATLNFKVKQKSRSR